MDLPVFKSLILLAALSLAVVGIVGASAYVVGYGYSLGVQDAKR